VGGKKEEAKKQELFALGLYRGRLGDRKRRNVDDVFVKRSALDFSSLESV
jgi:hypothetical protein